MTENDAPCPACGADVGAPCLVRIDGEDQTGWTHDARILAPVYADLRASLATPSERHGSVVTGDVEVGKWESENAARDEAGDGGAAGHG